MVIHRTRASVASVAKLTGVSQVGVLVNDRTDRIGIIGAIDSVEDDFAHRILSQDIFAAGLVIDRLFEAKEFRVRAGGAGSGKKPIPIVAAVIVLWKRGLACSGEICVLVSRKLAFNRNEGCAFNAKRADKTLLEEDIRLGLAWRPRQNQCQNQCREAEKGQGECRMLALPLCASP